MAAANLSRVLRQGPSTRLRALPKTGIRPCVRQETFVAKCPQKPLRLGILLGTAINAVEPHDERGSRTAIAYLSPVHRNGSAIGFVANLGRGADATDQMKRPSRMGRTTSQR